MLNMLKQHLGGRSTSNMSLIGVGGLRSLDGWISEKALPLWIIAVVDYTFSYPLRFLPLWIGVLRPTQILPVRIITSAATCRFDNLLSRDAPCNTPHANPRYKYATPILLPSTCPSCSTTTPITRTCSRPVAWREPTTSSSSDLSRWSTLTTMMMATMCARYASPRSPRPEFVISLLPPNSRHSAP